MTTVDALKALAAAYKGDGTTPDKISGETIPEVIAELTKIVTEKNAG